MILSPAIDFRLPEVITINIINEQIFFKEGHVRHFKSHMNPETKERFIKDYEELKTFSGTKVSDIFRQKLFEFVIKYHLMVVNDIFNLKLLKM